MKYTLVLSCKTCKGTCRVMANNLLNDLVVDIADCAKVVYDSVYVVSHVVCNMSVKYICII
jgi:hypothetical protein